MIDNCPSAVAADALARDVLASADCLIAGQVQQGYATLLAPGGTFTSVLTVALTIYVAIFGYRLMLGLSSLTLGEVVPHFVKIGIVFALTTSWPSYQTLVFDTLFHGPQQLADVIVRQAAGPSSTSGDVLTALQEVFARLTDAAGDAWGQKAAVAAPVAAAAPVTPGVAAAGVANAATTTTLPTLGAPQFAAALLWLSAAGMMAASVGVLLVVRIVLALLLLLGPLFVAFALFRSTRGLAEGWLRVTVKFALVPLFALPLIAAVVTALGPLVGGLDDAPIISVRNGPVPLIVLVVLVFAAVMAQAARLGSGIAGSIRLPRGPLAMSALGSAVRTDPTLVDRISTASRAETIVQAIGTGNRGMAIGAATAPAMIAATRTAIAPAAMLRPMTDNSGRLGQGYRRLAIGQTVPASAPRSRN